MDDDEVVAGGITEEELRVHRASLIFEREAESDLVDDAAGRREWVRSEVVDQEVDDLRLVIERHLDRIRRAV